MQHSHAAILPSFWTVWTTRSSGRAWYASCVHSAACVPCTHTALFLLSHQFNGTPYTWKGKEGVQKFFQEINENAEIVKFQPTKFFTDDDGDEVAAVVSLTLKGRENGAVETYDVVHVFTFDESGKIFKFYEVSNTAGYERLIGKRSPKFI